MDLYIRASEIKNNYNLILYRNRNESTFNVCIVTFSDHDDGLTSCGDDDELQFSEEQLAYINKNKEYIWEKKTEKDEMGELRYKQVVLGGDTALYRIIWKENEWTTTPTMTSVVYLLGLEGKFIDGQVFQKKLIDQGFL